MFLRNLLPFRVAEGCHFAIYIPKYYVVEEVRLISPVVYRNRQNLGKTYLMDHLAVSCMTKELKLPAVKF